MAARGRGEKNQLLMGYVEELTRAMTMLAAHPRSIFLGQSIVAGGTGLHRTFQDVPAEKKIEMPVMEDAQLGASIGLALGGFLPISCFPRVNFLLVAMSQLALHLDKISLYSDYRPKVIIRSVTANDIPLDPGAQHKFDYVPGLRLMLKTVEVVELNRAKDIVEQYHWAITRDDGVSSLIVEKMGLYDA